VLVKSIPTYCLCVFLLCVLGQSSKAQNTDTLLLKTHSPKTATLLSAVLPGAGQFYNKKYWKIPVAYVGFGVIGYLAYQNQSLYKNYKQAYLYRTDNNPNTIDNYPLYSTDALFQAKNYYRRNTELTVIIGVILYTLNIVDAAVDAHLYDFDISDDLSLRIQPTLINPPHPAFKGSSGLKLTLNF